MNSEPAPLLLYAPLWGVDFDSDDTGLVGGSTLASIPYHDEWQTLQRTVVADGRQRIANGAKSGVVIPLCLTIPVRLSPGKTLAGAVDEYRAPLLRALRRSVLALRLHQPGWFLNPELAEICFAIVDQGWSIIRQPGPYRQSFLAQDSPLPFAGYALKIDDLSRTREKCGAITQVWNQLAELESVVGNAPLMIALENFERSYGYQLTAADRLAHLFMALEAVLGGLTADAPGSIDLQGPGAKHYRRLKAALMQQRHNSVECSREATWVCDKEPGGGRWLRNRIAHGEPVDDGEGTAQFRLQAIVRDVLVGALDFYYRWPQESAALLAAHNLQPEDTPPIGVFNLILAQSRENTFIKP